MEAWYGEGDGFDYGSRSSYSESDGHFTQVVWESTKYLGAGRAVSKSQKNYFVVRYSPPGNGDYFQNNVKSPHSH